MNIQNAQCFLHRSNGVLTQRDDAVLGQIQPLQLLQPMKSLRGDVGNVVILQIKKLERSGQGLEGVRGEVADRVILQVELAERVQRAQGLGGYVGEVVGGEVQRRQLAAARAGKRVGRLDFVQAVVVQVENFQLRETPDFRGNRAEQIVRQFQPVERAGHSLREKQDA